MADDMGERTEKPTGRRRNEARRQGDVAKSLDVNNVAKLIAGAIVIAVTFGWSAQGLARVLRRGLTGELAAEPVPASILPWVQDAAFTTALLCVPLFGALFIIAAVASYLQVGWMITLKPIMPKWNRLDPIKGAMRAIKPKGLVKTGLAILKMSVMLIVATIIIRQCLPQLYAMPHMTALGAFALMGELTLRLIIWLLAILLLIAIVDLIYQRWQHTRDLRMTKQEVKDERRMMEGDPKIKNKRFAMYQKLVAQQIAKAVPQADVIVTNPTHFSVALKYEQGVNAAPVVTAKGVDELAMRIRYLAAMNNVPIVSRPPLARALYWSVEVGRPIRTEHYEAVAELLAYVYRIDARRAASRADQPASPVRRAARGQRPVPA